MLAKNQLPMKFLLKIIIHIFTNALAILIAVFLVKGISVENITFINLLKAGLLLGIINAFIRPIVKLLSLPFIILTFGLFTVIINIVLLLLTSYLIPSFSIDGFWPAFLGVVIVSMVNYLVSIFVNE